MSSNQIESMGGRSLFGLWFNRRHGEKECSERIALEDCSSARWGVDMRDFVEIMRAWKRHETEKTSLVFTEEIHFPKPFKRGRGSDVCLAPSRHWQKMAIWLTLFAVFPSICQFITPQFDWELNPRIRERIGYARGQAATEEVFPWFITVYQSLTSRVLCSPPRSSWRRMNLAASGSGRRINDDCMTGSPGTAVEAAGADVGQANQSAIDVRVK
jgi:hypothetical protein